MQSKALQKSRVRVLWVAPKLNHYRAELLRQLSSSLDFLRVVAGEVEPRAAMAAPGPEDSIPIQGLDCSKSRLAWSAATYKKLWSLVKSDSVDTVVMPLEKKFFMLVLFLSLLRRYFGFQLVTYNHPVFWKGEIGASRANLALQRALFSFYDKVIFYTSQSRDKVVGLGLVSTEKAYFANNTLVTRSLQDPRPGSLGKDRPTTILFVGKLDPRKRVDLLFKYFKAVAQLLPDLRLTIVGDGPDRDLVSRQCASLTNVTWVGAVTDEDAIALYMKESHLVLVPGDSGLSIVHAFCYAKPYATIAGLPGHGPELDYLVDGVNGILLEDDIQSGAERIAGLLSDTEAYDKMCKCAHESAMELSSDNWCSQIVHAIEA